MAKKTRFGVVVNGEHRAIFSSREEAETRAEFERAELVRQTAAGWGWGGEIKISVRRVTGRIW